MKYPESLYRVSVKAIIRDKQGRVLVVKEAGSSWNLPGGGMDHGETVHDALKRELYEEAQITAPFAARLVDTQIMYVPSKQVWQLWLVHEVELESLEYDLGADADEIAFLDTAQFARSPHRNEQFVYKFTHPDQND